MMYGDYYLEENKKAELIHIYFNKIFPYFFRVIKAYKEGKGFGIGAVCCGFAKDKKSGDYDYFGDIGVAILLV